MCVYACVRAILKAALDGLSAIVTLMMKMTIRLFVEPTGGYKSEYFFSKIFL